MAAITISAAVRYRRHSLSPRLGTKQRSRRLQTRSRSVNPSPSPSQFRRQRRQPVRRPVTLTVNGSPTTLTLSKGQATFTASTLPPGSIPVLATYNGDNNFEGNSDASFSELVIDTTSTGLVVTQNPSTLNQQVTFAATVSATHGGTPTGSVTFFDQTTARCSAPSSSVIMAAAPGRS